jgi:hypothetical protein
MQSRRKNPKSSRRARKTSSDFVGRGGVTNNPNNSVRRRCSITANFSSTAGSLISTIFGNALLATTSEFSGFAGQYQEYRVLATKVHIVPTTTNGAGVPLAHASSLIMCTDRSGTTTAPGSNVAAWRFSDARVYNGNNSVAQPIVYQARAIDITDQLWQPTTTSVDQYRVFLTGTADVASTSCGTYYVEYLVEFKGLL